MPDSERSPSNPFEGGIDLSNDAFDFDAISLTEHEYETILAELVQLPFVSALSDSLALNEISLAIPEDYTGTIQRTDFPNDLQIRRIGQWDYEDDTETRLAIELSTTRLFCSPEDEAKYFPGEYNPTAMFYAGVEFSLFPEVTDTTLRERADEELVLNIETPRLEGSELFNDLMTFLGYDFSAVSFTDGNFTSASIQFSGSREWRLGSYTEFQHSKQRSFQRAHLEASDPIKLPCGHETSPSVGMIQDFSDKMLHAFPRKDVAGTDCYVLQVNDEPVMMQLTELPSDVEPPESSEGASRVDLVYGYSCTDCGVFYAFVDTDAATEAHAPSTPIEFTEHEFDFGDDFEPISINYAPIPAYPVGYEDRYLSL